MAKTKFIYGFRKKLLDIGILIRLYNKSFRVFGFISAFKEISKYYQDNRCLFNTNPNRYLKKAHEIIAVPDMPPVNSKEFIEYIIQDIKWINHGNLPQPVFAIVCITSKCPFKCKYCYNSNLHTNEERLSKETIIENIRKLINNNIESIYLSGGEPMMRENDLHEIITEFKETKTRFWLLSTGYNLDIDKLLNLKKIGLKGVMISLDSIESGQINIVKGSQKAFAYAENAIRAANNAGLIVAIDSVFGKKLLERVNFTNFINFLGEKGAHFINCYSPKQMHHVLDGEYDSFTLTDFEKLNKLINNNHRSKQFKNLPITYSPDIWESKRGCVGGKIFIYIDPAGDVKKCPFIEKSYGNLSKMSLNEIMLNLRQESEENICNTNRLLKDKQF
ncbi:MAG: hypothetical protein C0596_05300 [Marinilabiliales bacterium]|nr:MAG: hypothetical protein C0596_05300 [Marinilabiliales bacterium]